MFSGLLPIGTVVKLTDVDVKIMIIGYSPVSLEEPDLVHDYSGLIYPIGYQGEDNIVQFDAQDVEYVDFLGLQDREQMAFEDYLLSKLEEEFDDDEEYEDEEDESEDSDN